MRRKAPPYRCFQEPHLHESPELDKPHRKAAEVVLVEEEGAEAGEAGDNPGQPTQAVITENESAKLVQLTQLVRDCLQLIASEVQDLKAARNGLF